MTSKSQIKIQNIAITRSCPCDTWLRDTGEVNKRQDERETLWQMRSTENRLQEIPRETEHTILQLEAA
jgi:agmatine/peptidylarginine deiminase